MYAIVSPFFKTFDDIWLTYIIPDFLSWKISVWQIVTIPFKENIEYWVILKIQKTITSDFDESKIKSLISIHNSFNFLSNYRVELISWIARYYFSVIHNSHNLFFPKNLTAKIINWKLDLTKIKEYKYNYISNITLSKEQERAYKEIVKSKNSKILFYWLTWSWKTEIYIKLIQDYLEKWKQTLFLIPEIILTNQLSRKIINVFWNDVIIINSTITDATKTKYWLDINSWNAKIIIWTRSAIFYPFNNLWLIIIDEEHDNSYISDSSPRYNTIEVANKINEINWNKLILGSWTPSINSMYKGVKWEYKIINLLEKFTW
jgi:primosomal protein N'